MFTYVCICVFRHTQHTHLFGLFFDFFDFFDWATGTLDKAHESHELENPVSLEKEAQNHHWGQRLNIHEIHEKCPSPKDESKDISAPLSSK